MGADERNVCQFTVGERVRLRDSIAPNTTQLHQDGTVVRADARGILIRFDRGPEILCEPTMLIRLSEGK